jgi:hypothetical protein
VKVGYNKWVRKVENVELNENEKNSETSLENKNKLSILVHFYKIKIYRLLW